MRSLSIELFDAAFAGDLGEVRKLVEAGADINTRDLDGPGPLLTFHPAVTEYLLAQGADPDVQTNEFGASVLAGLCYVNQAECVERLLQHGANPNHGRIESGETPLHHALAGGAEIEIIRLLVSHQADVNAKTKSGVVSYNFYGDAPTRGETPLHRAAAYASQAIVESLLSAGADRRLADAHGHLAHDWAGWHMRDKPLVEQLRPT